MSSCGLFDPKPGRAYLRAHLVGEPPALYERIGPAMRALVQMVTVDRTRPEVEYYRRRDQIELWLPVNASSCTTATAG